MFCADESTPDYGCCEGVTVFDAENPFGLIRIVIAVKLAGATAGGISGAEFYLDRLTGLPSGWEASVVGQAGTITVGDFVELHDPGDGELARRGNIVFSVTGPLLELGCQVGNEWGYVPLGVLTLSTFTAQEDLPTLYPRIIAGDPPGSPDFDCPLVTLCDSPAFTKVCVAGGEFIINNRMRPAHTPRPAHGATGVPHAGTALSWEHRFFRSCILGGFYQSIRFGKSTPPPVVRSDHPSSTFNPGVLEPFTTYYWQIGNSWGGSYGAISPIWSFTTGAQLPIEAMTWSAIKTLYR